MTFVAFMPLTTDFPPFGFVKFRKGRIAGNRGVHARQVQPVGA